MVRNQAYIKTIVRAIRGSAGRFLAIFSIVALGVGFLAGLTATTPDMRYSMGVYYSDTRFMDLRVVGNLGLCESDLAAIRNTKGIESAMGERSVDLQVVTDGGDTLVARLHGVQDDFWGSDDPSFLNRMTLTAGRWPERPDEIVIEQESRLGEGLTVGSTLTLLEKSEDLSLSRFTIVGTVTSGYYASQIQRGSTAVGNGRLRCIIYLCDSVFTFDYYTDIYAVVEGAAAQPVFSQGYDDVVAGAEETIKALADTQKQVRHNALVADAEQKLTDAQAEFDQKSADGQKKLGDARAALEEAERQLEDGRKKLSDGEADYVKGVRDLQRSKDDFAHQTADTEVALNEARIKLDAGRADYDRGLAELAKNRATLSGGEAEYADGVQQLADAEVQLSESKAQLDESKAQLDTARAKLDNSWADYNDGRAQLRDSKAQLDAAQKQIDDGCAALQAAIDQIWVQKEQTDALIGNDGLTPEQLSAVLGQFLGEDIPLPDEIKAPIQDFLVRLNEQLTEHSEDATGLAALISEGRIIYAQYSGLVAQGMVDLIGAKGTPPLEEAERQLAEGQAQYDAAAAKLSAAREKLTQGEQAYADGYAQWMEGSAQYQDGLFEYESNLEKLKEARIQLDDGWAALQNSEQLLADAKAELEANQRELEDGYAALAHGRQTAEQEFSAAAQKLHDARTQLDNGWASIAENEAELADGQKEYTDALETYNEEIDKAKAQLAEARGQIDDIAQPVWYVLTRDDNPGYAAYDSDTLKVESIAKVFPVFFFAVAALVASTTMTRMVDEERGHIGTLKALGYSNGKIAAKYLFYAGAAGLLGSAFGLLVGLRLFPAVLYNAYRLIYNLPKLRAADHAFYAVLSASLILAAILLATCGALRGSLQERAASLMRPKAPPAGKRILLERIGFLWKRMSFTHKVTARNLLRYKKRFFMTVIGIAGCTALLLTGFGLRDSISDIVGIQFGQLQKYNLAVVVRHPDDEQTDPALWEIFGDKSRITDYAAVHMESCTGLSGGESTDLYVVVPQDNAQLGDFITFRNRIDHTPVDFPDNAALLTEKAASALGVRAGDAILLRRTDGTEMKVSVGGIVENYVYGYLYLPRSLYEAGYGESCECTTLLCKAADTSEQTRDATSSALLSSPNTLSVQFTTTIISTFNDMLKSIDYIVVVLIISAGALAFVVLYNLTNINITERQKELATIKVLGFYAPEVSAYVYRETAILSLIGIAAGLFGGIFLHAFVVKTAEVDAVMFGRIIKPMSYVYSAAVTALFTALVNLAMNFKLRKIDMVESLKAPE